MMTQPNDAQPAFPLPAPLGPSAVEFSLEGPRLQRRVTVAFRLLLALPHLVYLLVLGLVAYLATIVGWFAALALGRLPDGIATFVARVVSYATRVYGYLYLLTDRYPGFSLDDDRAYPISIQVPEGSKLNRFSVLFRLVLLVPAGFVVSLATGGLTLAMPLVWLIVFVAGRLPTSLFESEAAVLRYGARFYAFAAMLTSDYPRGLFGDKTPPGEPSALGELPAPGAWAPPDQLATTTISGASPPPVSPRITRLVLSKAAKRILALFLLLGVGSQVASIALAEPFGDVATANRLEDDYLELSAASADFGAASQVCAIRGGLTCLRSAITDFRGAMVDYREKLQETRLPQRAVAVADDLDVVAGEIIEILDRLVEMSDPTQYQGEFSEFQDLAVEFDDLWAQLYDAVIG